MMKIKNRETLLHSNGCFQVNVRKSEKMKLRFCFNLFIGLFVKVK